MVTKFGQFTELEHFSFLNCPNFVTIFCRILKIKIIFFDIPSYPPPIAVQNSLTNQFFQKKLTILYIFNKKRAKLKRREGSFQLCKLSKLCYHFLSSFENGNYFFDIPSNPPPIAVRNSLTNRFFQKNLRFCIFSTKKKNRTSLNRDIHSILTICIPYILLLTY